MYEEKRESNEKLKKIQQAKQEEDQIFLERRSKVLYLNEIAKHIEIEQFNARKSATTSTDALSESKMGV
jgi:hypothetical protein